MSPFFSVLHPAAKPPKWLHELECCSSTNTWANDHPAELQHGDVVFTHHQTAGRGQQGRVWCAPPGGLTASFVIDRLPLAHLSGFSLAAGLAVIHAIEELLPELHLVLQLKWPNDVLVKRRKLAGILCETSSRHSASQTRVVVGVGLNRAVDFGQAGLDSAAIGNPISLNEITQPPDEPTLLERLRHHLLQVSEQFALTDINTANINTANSRTKAGLAPFLLELRQRDALLGNAITLQQTHETIAGRAAGIDAEGRLVLQLSDRQVQVTSGHILW